MSTERALSSCADDTERIEFGRRSALRRLGPGLVAGVSDDDPSAVGTYSRLGAKFGFTFVWGPLLALPIMAAAQVAASRIGIVRTRGLAAVAKEELPQWVAYSVLVPVVLAGTFTLGADLRAMASAMGLVVPLPELLLLGVLSLGTLALQVLIPYRRARYFLQVFALGIVSYFGVVVAAEVDWSRVADAVVAPHLAIDHGGLAALIAIVGAAISPYVLVWQPSVEIEEADLHPDKMRRRAVRDATIDVSAGVTVAMLAACAMLIASGATLKPAGITDVKSADQAARALAPLLGQGAEVVFAVGVVAVGLLAAPILAGGAAFVTSDLFGWRTGLGHKFRDVPGFYSIFALAVATSLLLGAFGVEPIQALYLASIANGVSAPGLLLILAWLARSPRVLGTRRIGNTATAFLAIGAALTAVLPIAYLATIA